MNNLLNIAKKEFLDLLSSEQIIIILCLYAILFFVSIPDIRSTIESPDHGSLLSLFSYDLCFDLTYYGGLVAIVIGFASISNELNSKAINTLVAKPVYRDEVINGKLIGIIGFISGLLVFSALFYVLVMIVFANVAANVMFQLVGVMPLILIFSLLVLFFYMSITLFLSIVIKNDNLALFSSFFVWIIMSYLIQNLVVARYLSTFISQVFATDGEAIRLFISGLSPTTMLRNIIIDGGFAPDAVFIHGSEFIKLILYGSIMIVISYSAFIKRDIN